MKRFSLIVMVLLFALVSTSLFAEDQPKKKKKQPNRAQARAVMGMVKGLELTEEQKEKLAAIQKEVGPEISELMKAQRGLVSKEQQAKAMEAVKAAKEEGKKGKELMEIRNEALGLSPEQVAKQKEIQEKMQALRKSVQEKVMSILTDEQKKQLKAKGGDKKKKKNADE